MYDTLNFAKLKLELIRSEMQRDSVPNKAPCFTPRIV